MPTTGRSSEPGTIEVFADLGCPFAHISLRYFTARRAELGRDDIRFRVRAWPLEVVNGTPLDAAFIAEEVEELRPQVDADLFTGFRAEAFPATFLPALALEAAAYDHDAGTGERVSLELRDRLFARGEAIGDPAVLAAVAAAHGIVYDPDDQRAPLRDHQEGVARGVIGSPHYFAPSASFFCPTLHVRRDEAGRLVVRPDPDGFDQLLASCSG